MNEDVLVAPPRRIGSPPVEHDRLRVAHERKRDTVLRAAATRGADSVLLTTQPALAWYLEGARVGVNRAGDPVVAVRVDARGDRLVVFENEADRIVAEEVPPGLALTLAAVPWFGGLADGHGDALSETAIAAELRTARRRLHPHELDAYRALGIDAARAVTDALRHVDAASTERAVAGAVAGRLEAAGAETLVVLVAGSSRRAHRHPLPTDAVIGDRTMVVVCARRRGLIANLTRWFGTEPSATERSLEDRIAEVEADALAATEPGRPLSDVLARIADSYVRHGFDADEWRRHHQGGPTGYAGRDPRATPAASDLVTTDQAFSWNPSAPGAKIEDTVLRTASGFEVLTHDERWPTRETAGLRRPVTLVR